MEQQMKTNFVCEGCGFTAQVYNVHKHTLCNKCITKQKEQQMTHKFKVGDRVRYINTHIKSWIGNTGTVIRLDNSQYIVEFDEGSPCIADNTFPNPHRCYASKLELIPMQDKVLIKPEDYHTLKKDDEVEIIVKGFLIRNTSTHGMSLTDRAGSGSIHVNLEKDYVSVDNECIKEVYKLTPKATKLEVGEILTQENVVDSGWKVLHINKKTTKKQLTLLNIDNDISFITGTHNNNEYYEFKRKSGIPIDWEATFS